MCRTIFFGQQIVSVFQVIPPSEVLCTNPPSEIHPSELLVKYKDGVGTGLMDPPLKMLCQVAPPSIVFSMLYP